MALPTYESRDSNPAAARKAAGDAVSIALHPPEPSGSAVPNAGLARLRERLGTYLRPEDLALVEDAYRFSAEAHTGQFRISGDPYISHPLAVAEIIADWKLDAQAIIAALLHDVMEDAAIGKEAIATRFGRQAAELVDGVSKLDRIESQSFEDAQAENYRKMLLAMARDVRVMLIKLADRLHNMRTLGSFRPDKRRRIARETMDIYAPIANRLGLNGLYRELQELALRHAYPMRYRVLDKSVRAARGNRREVVEKILAALRGRLRQQNIVAEVSGREKGLASIYRKMHEKHLSFSEVLDIYGFRVTVATVPECYLALGALHSLYKPVPGKFKDYIAIPKANGYQSLHTTLIGPFGAPIEVQMRTHDMHRVAESGVASHWLYKDSGGNFDDLQRKTHNWLQSLIELQQTSGDTHEFLEHVKVDLFPDEVYVFTPKGKIFALPRGATPVDFAYAVHTDIGHRCVACRINHELMPLRTALRNGDRVEIITAPHPHPNPAWLAYVKTGKARAQIRMFHKNVQRLESADLGERLLTQALRRIGLLPAAISEATWGKFLHSIGAKDRQHVLIDIGLGKRLAGIVARRLAERADKAGSPDARSSGSLLIRGSEGGSVQLASCCRPIPGDPIVGLVRKGQGLMIHTHDCPSVRRANGERDKWIDVDWEIDPERYFDVSIRALVLNRPGSLGRIATEIAAADSNIRNVGMDEDEGPYNSIYFTLQVSDRVHLARILRNLRRMPEVVRIVRLKGDSVRQRHLHGE